VARTTADLDGSEQIHDQHMLEALGFRLNDVAA
jgi:predicted ATPase with chaperone activity